MTQFTTLGMSEAVVKQIAESSSNENIKELVSASLKSYITLVLSFMVITILFFALFSHKN